MAPRVKITRKDIIETALELVRVGGADAVNARSIASKLNCSTQPIFSNFESMEELEEEVGKAAYSLYQGFITRELESQSYPQYKAFGMAYVLFAIEERELFKLLFMRDRTGEDISPSPDFEESVKIIMASNGVTREVANLMHLEMWICVHGIATMMVTSFFTLKLEEISDIISDMYQSVRSRHVGGDVK